MGDNPLSASPVLTSASSLPSYLDFLKEKTYTEFDAPMCGLSPGWGLKPDLYPPTGSVVYDPKIVPWLTEQFENLIRGLPAPADDVREKMTKWRLAATKGAYPEDGVDALLGLVRSMAEDILKRHSAFKVNTSPSKETEVPPADTAESQKASSEKDDPSDISVEELWHVSPKMFGSPGRQRVRNIRMERASMSNGRGLGAHMTLFTPLTQERAAVYIPKILGLAKEGASFQMGVSSSRFDVSHLLQLIARTAQGTEPCHILLTSYHTSILLRLSRSSGGAFITCSDIIKDCLILPALLCSLQFACLGPIQESALYSGVPWFSSSPKSPPLERGLVLYRDEDKQKMTDFPLAQFVLAFAPLGSTRAAEHHLLHRTQGKASTTDQANSTDGVNSGDQPLLTAFREIGAGTCGRVYLAHYGRHHIAVKVCPPEEDEDSSLFNEYEIYGHIRAAGLEGKVTPRCFGLYKNDDMVVLLTAYSGVAISDFGELSIEDRLSIFRCAKALEDKGICQGSFSPRNVVCDENNIFRIIDFHRGTLQRDRKADLERMHEIYFDRLELDWRHVVPLPESDDSDLQEAAPSSTETVPE